jgi:hypothetical protein
MSRDVVEKMKRILGKEHPNTVLATRNLQIVASRIQEASETRK